MDLKENTIAQITEATNKQVTIIRNLLLTENFLRGILKKTCNGAKKRERYKRKLSFARKALSGPLTKRRRRLSVRYEGKAKIICFDHLCPCYFALFCMLC